MNLLSINFAGLAVLNQRDQRTFVKGAGMFVILATIFFSGCSSMEKPESASFASVVIANQAPEKIRQTTIAVFQDSGYQIVPQSDSSLVFEREATRREQLDYAGFAGTQQGDKVVIRVRVQIRTKDPNSYWLECKAFAVRNPGQPVFEQTTPLFNFQSKSYQKLLDQVAKKMAMAAPTP
jgi:hypothetical protein